MSNLLASLHAAGTALDVYQQALGVVQNNITNSTTPGYAKQSLNLSALPLDSAAGLAGGVSARGLASARDEYAEEEVRRQLQALGRLDGQAQGTASIEGLFDVSGGSGMSADLDKLFQSFSAWSVSPSDAGARQSVVASAGNLADDVRGMAESLAKVSQNVQDQIGSTVATINQLDATIQQYNQQRVQKGNSDPGADANVHAALEQLSELANITTVTQADGSITVLLDGGSPLVVGQTAFAISADSTGRILDWQGSDATTQVTGGKLGGLLDVRNRIVPSLIGDSGQTGSLNQFAHTLADTVNGILQSGFTAPQATSPDGAPLFTYDTSNPAGAAASLHVNENLTADDLAPVDASGNANGNALKLASLATSASAGGVDGIAFGQYFSLIAAGVGRESAAANANRQTQSQVVAQTRALRDQTSGVSLDEQATLLLQFQKSYQAAARLLTTLNDIMQETINLIK
jgi:flagellar hook-associated protein 1 FlgK